MTIHNSTATTKLSGAQQVPSNANRACSLNPQKNREWLAQ
jgi:hypothetical protein